MIQHEASRPKDCNEDRVHPPPTGAPQGATLSPHHVRYLAERGVGQGVASGAFWTARKPSEVPAAFSERQRRRTPALIAAHISPDGRTVSWQMRPDNPFRDRKGRPVKWVSPQAEKAPVVLNAPDAVAHEVRHGTGPLWITEGATRSYALAGRGIPAVSYAGSYTWQKDGEPLPCFEHINLAGRLVYDVPDADARTNENVHKAQARRVAYLESRGARVLTVSVPEVDGDPNTGLDDYIAAGGDLEVLTRNAAPFVPVEVGRERLKRDEGLRLFVAAMRQEIPNLPTRKARECSGVAVLRYMVEEAVPEHGKAGERGVVVHPSYRQIASGIRVGVKAVKNAVEYLAELGVLERVEEPRGRYEAASYLLLYPSNYMHDAPCAQGKHIGEQGGAGKESQEHREEREVPFYKRDSYGCVSSVHNVHDALSVPPLRNSKFIITWGRKDGRRVVVDFEYIPRYGTKRGEIIRYLHEVGTATRAELHEKFGSPKSRPGRFVQTWIEPMVRDGVVACEAHDGEGVYLLTPDWPEALARVRERTGEDEDNRRQDKRYADQRKARRARMEGERRGDVPKPEPTPPTSGPEKNRERFREARRRDYEARVEEIRHKVGTTPETFVADAMRGVSGFAWRELRQEWIDKGGATDDLRRVVSAPGSPYRFNRSAGDALLYVEAN